MPKREGRAASRRRRRRRVRHPRRWGHPRPLRPTPSGDPSVGPVTILRAGARFGRDSEVRPQPGPGCRCPRLSRFVSRRVPRNGAEHRADPAVDRGDRSTSERIRYEAERATHGCRPSHRRSSARPSTRRGAPRCSSRGTRTTRARAITSPPSWPLPPLGPAPCRARASPTTRCRPLSRRHTCRGWRSDRLFGAVVTDELAGRPPCRAASGRRRPRMRLRSLADRFSDGSWGVAHAVPRCSGRIRSRRRRKKFVQGATNPHYHA